MDGIWVICCMDTISMTFVKLVALQGLIVLKAGCTKHGWEVHGLPHVVSDFGVSWRLAHLIETMLRWCWANLPHNLSFSVQTKPVLFAKSHWWNGSLAGVIWIWSSRAHGQLNFKAPLDLDTTNKLTGNPMVSIRWLVVSQFQPPWKIYKTVYYIYIYYRYIYIYIYIIYNYIYKYISFWMASTYEKSRNR